MNGKKETKENKKRLSDSRDATPCANEQANGYIP
jgi:hypothetical protein